MAKEGIRVLIVDDEKQSLDSMGNIIGRRAKSVFKAQNATDAEAIFLEKKPNLVISDIMMPVKNGLEMISDFQKIDSHFKTIIMSAYSDTNYFLNAIEHSVDRYLVKPINKTRLLQAYDHVAKQLLLEFQIEQHKKSLEESERKLKESNLTKDKFFSIISHDLKSPLGSVISFSNLITDEFDELSQDEIKKFTHIIKNSAELTLELLDDILNWSRAQTGKISFRPAFININQIINDMIKIMSNQAAKKDIQISTNTNCSGKIWGDKNIIETILRNLLGNSVKFTKPGGSISVQCSENGIDSASKCIISVVDNGIGMSQKKVDRLFVINDDLSQKGTAGEKGTGLGLLLCKELVQIHGGKIFAESKPGKGSNISFCLPNLK